MNGKSLAEGGEMSDYSTMKNMVEILAKEGVTAQSVLNYSLPTLKKKLSD